MWLENKLYWLEKDINFWCHLEFWSYLTTVCVLFLVWILSLRWNFSNRVPTLVSQRRINSRNIGCALSYLLLMNRWCTELELVVLLFQHRTFSVVTFRFTDHIMTTEVVNLCQGTGQLERLCCTSHRQCSWSSGFKYWSIFKSVANLHMPSLHRQRRPQAAANDWSKHKTPQALYPTT